MIKKIIKYIRLKLSSPEERANIIRKSMKLGKGCEIYDDVSFGSEPYLIEIGNKVRITTGVKFITHDGGMWVLRNNGYLENADLFRRIKIGDNVHIGINSIIMPGVTIGNNVIVGVGAVVTKDIPDNSVAVGVPARVIKTIDEYFEKNKGYVDFTKDLSANDKKVYLCKKYKINN